MPNRKQRKKTVLTAEKSRLLNKTKSSAMKTQVKKFLTAVEAGNKSEATEALILCQKRIDKAAKTRVIHPNNAARKKSALARKLNALSS